MEFWSPGSFFPKKIGPGDQYSMEFWSPGPIFHGILVPRTNFPVTVQLKGELFLQSWCMRKYKETAACRGTEMSTDLDG